MTYPQFLEWSEYLALEPPAADRIDVMLAQLAAITAEINRNKTRRSRPFEMKDFYPDYGGKEHRQKKRRRQTVAEQAAIFATFAEAHNAANRKHNANRS